MEAKHNDAVATAALLRSDVNAKVADLNTCNSQLASSRSEKAQCIVERDKNYNSYISQVTKVQNIEKAVFLADPNTVKQKLGNTKVYFDRGYFSHCSTQRCTLYHDRDGRIKDMD